MTPPASADRMMHELRAIVDDLARSGDTGIAGRRLTTTAADLIEGCDWSGITRHSRRHGYQTAAASSAVTVAVDRLQYALHEGPCLDAIAADGIYHAPDLTATTSWPRFSARTVAQTPVRSVLSITLHRQSPRAALNLYARQPAAFGADGVDLSRTFAAQAQVLVHYMRAIDKISNLEHALTSSRLIGSAVGILMYADKITGDEAFERLTTASQRLNRKLVDVADQVTRTGELPSI